MKRIFCLVIFLLVFSSSFCFGDEDEVIRGEYWHLAITFRDGTVKEGYLFWFQKDLKDFAAVINKMYLAKYVPLYKKVYSVNDGGKFGWKVLCEDDIDWLNPPLILSAKDIDPERKEFRPSYSLTMEQIKVMQSTLVFYDYGGNGPCSYGYFSYNPAVSKKELHNYVMEYQKWDDSETADQDAAFQDELKSKKIVIVKLGCSD